MTIAPPGPKVMRSVNQISLHLQPSSPAGVDYGLALLERLAISVDSSEAPRIIGITSSRTGEGVSTVATGLAMAAAKTEAGRSTLLVDANLNLPALQRYFGADLSEGLSDYVAGRLPLGEVIQPSHISNLSLLAAGTRPMRGLTSDEAQRLSEFIQEVRRGFDLVVIDLPPIIEAGLTMAVARLVDGVLLVVEAEGVDRQTVRRTLQLLGQARARVLGAVLNKQEEHVPDWLRRRLA